MTTAPTKPGRNEQIAFLVKKASIRAQIFADVVVVSTSAALIAVGDPWLAFVLLVFFYR